MIRTVNKPWGKEVIWAESSKYAGKILVINPGHRLSRQYHEKKEESIYVVNGPLRFEHGQGEDMKISHLNTGESVDILPGTIHRFCAEDKIVILFEVSTPELDDVVRLEDDYSR